MSRRLRLRALSTVLALGILALAASPAAAASEVAKGSANAVTVSLAGNAQGTGVFTASNDGTNQTTSGTNTPPLTVLGGFPGAGAGTLNQDAGTAAPSGAGQATACAGLAGNGATLVQVGRSSCLQPKDTLALNAGSVDISKLDPSKDIIDSAFNQAILGQLPAGTPASAAQPLTDALTAGFQAAFNGLGNPSLSLNLGVIQGRCTAQPGDANGSANLVGASLVATFPAASGLGSVPLLDFQTNPDPNTRITADLGAVTAKALGSLGSSLTGTLNAIPGASAAGVLLATLTDGSKVLTDGISTLTSQLGPLDQVISGTLNKQSHPDGSSIDVTALDLNVLPAAAQALNTPLANLQVGHVTCAAANAARVDAPVAAPAVADADVPSVIDSGLPGDSHADLYRTLLGALLLVGAGGIAVRRLLVSRSSD
ncbi:MAG: hypothetical protein JWO46_2400 [Nocardioidaceae bacterium]|nr:hypothetical protein [Nocardioidaceae bacterium]